MEWTDEKVLMFIKEYKVRPVLWDPNNADYKLLNKKNDSWRSLANAMDTDVGEVKKKINSLLASLRRERSKEKKMSGMAANERYQSTWFAYKPLAFLMDKFKMKNTRSSEDIGQSNEEEIPNDDVGMHTTESLDVEESKCTTFTIQRDIQNQATSSGSDLKRKATSKHHNQSRIKEVDAQLNDVVDVIKTFGNKTGANKSVAKKSKYMEDAFGEYIASKIRGYSHYTKSIVQHKINNILYEADMGMYEQPGHTVPLTVCPIISQEMSSDTNSTTED